MKDNLKKFFTSSVFKKIVIATAITAATAAAAALTVKAVKKHKRLLESNPKTSLPRAKNIYISGNSIAALAAAAYLIKDGGYSGSSIHVYGSPSHSAISEEYGSIGEHFRALMEAIEAQSEDGLGIYDMINNSEFAPEPVVKILDGSGNVRTLDISPDRSVLKAINKALKKAENGELDEISIREYFADMGEIFDTDLFSFIEMSFGIRDEHKVSEFLKRAEQVLVDAPRTGFYDTLYYEFSAAAVLENYLAENGVDYHPDAEITDFDINDNHITAINLTDDGTRMTIYLNNEDRVIFTAGNISDNRSEGSYSESAPVIEDCPPSFNKWIQIAQNDETFGVPACFITDCPTSMELSIVDENNYLTNRICEIIGEKTDYGISLLLTSSNWRMKLATEGTYSFAGSEESVDIAIDYAVETTDGADAADLTEEDINAAEAIAADNISGCITVKGMYCTSHGNFVDKPMRECSGAEILYELCGHLGIIDEWEKVLENISITMVTNYPVKNAPLTNAEKSASPRFRACDNCYLIGSFVENSAPTCTLEQEVLSAKKAAYALMGIKEKKGFLF